MEEYILTPNLQIKGKCVKLCISTNEKFIALLLEDNHLVLYQIKNKKWEIYSDHLFNIRKNYSLETIRLTDRHQLFLEIGFKSNSRIIRKETFVFLKENNLWRRLFISSQRIMTSAIQDINLSCFSIISVLTSKYYAHAGEGFFSFFQTQYRDKILYRNAFESKILLFNERINNYVYVIENCTNNKNESIIVSKDIKSQLSYSVKVNHPVWTLAYDRSNLLQVYADDDLFLYQHTDQGFKLQFQIAIQLQKYGSLTGIPTQCQLIKGKYLRLVFWTEDFDLKGRKSYFNVLIENELKNKQFTFQKRMPKKMQVKGFFLSASENIFILQESEKVFHLYITK